MPRHQRNPLTGMPGSRLTLRKWGGAQRALLHHFYEPFPVVEHFQPVALATR